MAVDEHDYRDDYPLSESIAEAYTDGCNDGSSPRAWARTVADRDYAMARADRLEQQLVDAQATIVARDLTIEGLEREVGLLVAGAVEREQRIAALETRLRLLEP